MAVTTGSRLGPFEILGAIGAGGMGEVYRARDARLKRDVAIKILPEAFATDAERLARFQREAEVVASLNHSNIAQIYGVEESVVEGGRSVRALVLELVEGETLADRIAQGAIPLEEALPIARQIAEALEAAHEHGIVHRDLKPANIKLTKDGTVKVLDFGLAKTARASDAGRDFSRADVSQSPTITTPARLREGYGEAGSMAGAILGTAAYMSPEQAKGKPVDKRTDIWAFGCVLFEMLTGTRAFEGEDVSDTVAAILRAEPDWSALQSRDPIIASLVRGCLEKDRRRRIGDIAAVRFALANATLRTIPSVSAPIPAKKRYRAALLACAAALAGAAIAAATLKYGGVSRVEQPARRLSIALPGNAVVTHLALSPDGRRLALTLSGMPGGIPEQIWIRSLGSGELAPLSGTTRARTPFWSHDGRYVGFFADGKLKMIPANGGPVTDLCEGTGLGFGGTWNRDDVILLGAGGSFLGLRRVNVRQPGSCSAVTKTDARHVFPTFLPDGNHFLYVDFADGDANRRGVYLSSLNGAAPRRILADVSSVLFVPAVAGPGHLVFLREGTLVAQRFNDRTLQLEDDPVVVAAGAALSVTSPQMAVASSDDGMLVYVANRVQTSQFTWIDREGAPVSDVGSAAVQQAVILSPGEETLAFVRGENVWLRGLSGGAERPFFAESGFGRRSAGAWSPDGRQLVFGRQPSSLFVKDVQTGTEQELETAGDHPKVPSDWSRGGEFVVYTELNPKTRADIAFVTDPLNVRKSRKSAVFLASAFEESQAQLSPDGRWIAYTSDEAGQLDVYVSQFPSGLGKRRVSPLKGREPRWRSDGKELYYLDGNLGRFALMAVSVTLQGDDLRFGTPNELFGFAGRGFVPQANIFLYEPSRDGRRFLVNVLTSDEKPTLNVITNWQASVTSR